MITASHNPPSFNGFKVKAHFGGSATPAITAKIEANLGKSRPLAVQRAAIEMSRAGEVLLRTPEIARRLGSALPESEAEDRRGLDARLRRHHPRGTAARHVLHGPDDPRESGSAFRRHQPGTDDAATGTPWRSGRKAGSDVGLATDGDADRLGIVDENGQYVNTLQTLSLLLLHVYRNKGWRGAVARTYSQSLLIPRIAEKFGSAALRVPDWIQEHRRNDAGETRF